jgi:hypothetical protein
MTMIDGRLHFFDLTTAFWAIVAFLGLATVLVVGGTLWVLYLIKSYLESREE